MLPVHVTRQESLSHGRKRGNKVKTNPCTNRFLERKDKNRKVFGEKRHEQKADETTFYMDQVWDTTPNGKKTETRYHTLERYSDRLVNIRKSQKKIEFR